MASSLLSAAHDRIDLSKLKASLRDTVVQNWYLGFTSFGGPAVHFQIYQENFALTQSLPGPGSTKMLYAINVVHGGFVAGIVGFLIWSLPGALGAYALGVGVGRIGERLPEAAYALLSGLNGATVGIVAVAAVQLASKAITDKLTLLLVFMGGAAGVLYQALWYYPVLMFVGGCLTVVWDYGWLQRVLRAAKIRRNNRRVSGTEEDQHAIHLQETAPSSGNESLTTPSNAAQRRPTSSASRQTQNDSNDNTAAALQPHPNQLAESATNRSSQTRLLTWKTGLAVTVAFFTTFVTTMILRGALTTPPRGFSLFANLYLAGTIIFGGGPVVIPLLREYVVAEGWVSPRDFLLGLALIQAFPGPNFNFAVYLGTLAVATTSLNPAAGAAIGYIAIFAPGLILHTGTMGVWNVLRKYRWAISGIRGVNATAVGLIYTAVYRLWQIGWLGAGFSEGSQLGGDPWWVVVTVTSFVGGRWFGVPAPVAILVGGAMGVIWWGVTGR